LLKPSLLIALLCLGTVLQGEQPDENCDRNCDLGPRTMRVAARHIEAGGVGYNKGYTTLEAFIATDRWRVMPFLDLRGHVFNDGKMAANAGLGARSIWGCRAYGISAYYDYRNTHHRSYNQVSLGLESLGKLWDVRVNGYLPVGGKISHPYNIRFAGFSGHSILINRKFQYAMKGIDGEIGFHFGKTSKFDFYGAAGPYYFKGEIGKGAIGGKARLAGYYKEYITLEVSDSWDNVFHNNVQGQITFSLPFGPRSSPKPTKSCCSDDACDFANILAARMLQPVDRQEIVVVNSHHKKKAADTFVIFVNNLSHSAGTYESPYATLADAQNNSKPGDVIYVFPGDGTPTGMNQGIVLQDNQQLLGSSTPHVLTTNLGTITIPFQTRTVFPTIGNNTSPVITIANNNVISGFNIDMNSSITGKGISNGLNPIANLIVQNNTIIANGNPGLNLTNVSGNVYISNNTITNETFSAPAVYIASTNINHANYNIANNILSDSTELIHLEYTDCSSIATNIENNRFTNDEPAMIILVNNSSSMPANAFNFSSNIINTQDFTDVNITLSNFANANINFNENTLDNNYADGVDIILNNDSVCSLSFTNNRMRALQKAISIQSNDRSIINMVASNNYFSGGDDNAIGIATGGGANANVTLTGNTLSSIDGNVVSFINNSTAASLLSASGNSLYSPHYDNAFFCTAQNTGGFSARINNNIISLGTIFISNTSSANFQSSVNGNQLTGASVTITNTSTGTLCQQFNHNVTNPAQYSNGSNPYVFSNTGAGTFNLEPLTGNTGYFTLTGVTSVPPNTCSN